MGDRLVTFVCTANQCRSPMAEYLLKKRLGPETSWKVASAGTSAIGGFPASSYAIEALEELGIDLRGHRSAPLTEELVDSSEVILVMTRMHLNDIVARYPEARDKVFLMTSFGASSDRSDVTDPVGMSVEVYRKIRDTIDSELPDVIFFLHGYGGV